jgi:bifunctional non-homologous end joining protein LigD
MIPTTIPHLRYPLVPADSFTMLTKELSRSQAIRTSFIKPMYAQAIRALPEGKLWSYDAKLDGYRCLAAKDASGAVLWSRRGNGFTTRFPEIARACAKLPPNTLIDGEVVAIDENGRISGPKHA